MRRYDAYKDSGIEWIGEIPEAWEACRFKQMLSIIGGNDFPPDAQGHESGDYPFCKVSDINGDGWSIESAANYVDRRWTIGNRIAVVPTGSILMAKVGAALSKNHRKINLCDCCIDNNMQAIVPDDEHVITKYMYWLLSIVDMAWYDTGGTLPYVDNQKFLNDNGPLPSLEEQQLIADYLDAKTAEIDELVADCEREIVLLQEYRKAVISEVVTKGLDPDAPMKDSGIEWIGEIPTAWNLPRLGFLTDKIGSGKTPRGGVNVYVDSGIMFLRSQNVYDNGLHLDNVVYISEKTDEEMSSTRVFFSDVLLNITGGSIGRCCVYDLPLPANVNQHVCIIRLGRSALPKFIQLFWNSQLGSTTIDMFNTGANREGMNFEQIGSTRVPLPSIDEQRAIVAYLDSKTSKIDTLIDAKQRMANLLYEYRKSLISEAVTGKFKVPGV